MKRTLVISIFFISCNNTGPMNRPADSDTSHIVLSPDSADTPMLRKKIWAERMNDQNFSLPDSIGGKSVSYYLDHPDVEPIAKAFFNGELRPSDNDSTEQLLSYITTDDQNLRPFYRWCLDFTISMSDGALAEYPGKPAFAYATKFPAEFFAYMAEDSTHGRYDRWTEIISYSGLDDYEARRQVIQDKIVYGMNKNCRSCNDEMRKRITKFARDVSKELKP